MNYQGMLSHKRKQRKSRCTEGERNFHCGCGKSYLSYPALYTHVKTKHNGIFPNGCQFHKN